MLSEMQSEIIKIAADAENSVYDRLSELDRLCVGADGWSADSFRSECAKDNGIVLACFSGDTVIALLSAYTAVGEADITSVAVRPEFRRRGLAYRLMDEFEKLLPDDTESIFLEVRESNSAAIALYEKCGFQRLSIRKNFYSEPRENAAVMQKKLTKEG